LRQISLTKLGALLCDVGREARCGIAEEGVNSLGKLIAFFQ
jgi:hypothetical protein